MGMIQTTQTELEALFEKMLPHFLEYLKAHGTPVDRIELATSLHGITSLPARMDIGGVTKTVLAPLHLLSDVAEDAARECRVRVERFADQLLGLGIIGPGIAAADVEHI